MSITQLKNWRKALEVLVSSNKRFVYTIAFLGFFLILGSFLLINTILERPDVVIYRDQQG